MSKTPKMTVARLYELRAEVESRYAAADALGADLDDARRAYRAAAQTFGDVPSAAHFRALQHAAESLQSADYAFGEARLAHRGAVRRLREAEDMVPAATMRRACYRAL